MNAQHLLVAASLLLFASCGGGEAPEAAKAPLPENVDAQQRIRTMEDSLSTKAVFDRRRVMELRDVYLAYVQRFPLDSLSPDMLRKAASTTGDLGEHEKAIGLWDRLIKDYPSWARTPDAYYFRAFEIENGLGKKGEAKTAYEEFIAKYPDNQFADDAAKMIEYMRYTDEQLIELFKKKNADQEAAAAK
jgi:TolA-binding protein